MQKDLTCGRPGKVLLRFALPVIGGNLFQLFNTLADVVIVGKTLGADALAAVGSTSIVSYFVLCFIQGLTGGFGICLGQRFGARDEDGMRKSAAASWLLSVVFAVALTALLCPLTRPLLHLMRTPSDIFEDAWAYLFVILLGTGATVVYNASSNLLRALGDSRTPLVFLIFSSLLNIALDYLFLVPIPMGTAGAAWATILSQAIAAAACIAVGVRKFPVLRSCRADWAERAQMQAALRRDLAVGFPMGFQMSVMCIGQVAMQAGVNALGASAIAGYTAATKVDQISVLLNGAFGVALSNYVAQNCGAGRFDRIQSGVRAGLLQTECANLIVGAGLLLLRQNIVSLFLDAPTREVVSYAEGYLLAVVPFYLLLGLLLVYRTAVQSMGNGKAPFAACIVELVMRIGGTFGLSALMGYTGVCLSSPLAWAGATALLLPVYASMMRANGLGRQKKRKRPQILQHETLPSAR